MAALLGGAALCWLLMSAVLGAPPALPPLRRLLARPEVPPTEARPPPALPCALPRRCPPHHFPFRLRSGAANVVGPKICVGGKMLMSSAQNNVGRGLNVALVNGVTGELMAARSFDMWAGDANELLKFLRPLHEGTVVLVASYDDPATRLSEECRRLLAELGSGAAASLGFRDSWVFVGGKGVSNSPFEQHIRNSRGANRYEGWPQALQMEGCIPQRRPP